jgi:hypothetical protein
MMADTSSVAKRTKVSNGIGFDLCIYSDKYRAESLALCAKEFANIDKGTDSLSSTVNKFVRFNVGFASQGSTRRQPGLYSSVKGVSKRQLSACRKVKIILIYLWRPHLLVPLVTLRVRVTSGRNCA